MRIIFAGNHEYYTMDAEAWLRKLSTLGVTVLHNNNVVIKGKGGGQFCLAGVDDPTADLYRYKSLLCSVNCILRTIKSWSLQLGKNSNA